MKKLISRLIGRTDATREWHHASEKPETSKAVGVDPETIMRIQNLELRARMVVEGFMSGRHRSPYHGFSVEFTDYRPYSPGDDLRHLDWKLLARRERLYIKRFEDETNFRCHLLVDLSQSMAYGSRAFSKADYAKTTAATLAHFLMLQRDAVGLITFDEQVGEHLPSRFRNGQLRRLLLALERATGGRSTDLVQPLEQVANRVTKRGVIILISDLLVPAESLLQRLGYLRSMGHDLLVLRVLDRQEVDFAFDSTTLFRDLETGQLIYVDPPSAVADYRRRFQEHGEQLRRGCDDLGVDLYTLLTDEPFDVALFDLIQARSRRGRHHRFQRTVAGGVKA